MYVIEKKHILTDPNIVFYRRYRDDLLIFYQGNSVELQALMSRMNNAHDTLKFTFETSDNLITYLDLDIFKGVKFREHGLLDHSIHCKKSDTHQWLCPKSAHCPQVFSALVFGETIRYCRGHTSMTSFTDKVQFFTDKLVDRGYIRSDVDKITSKVKFENRNDYLKTKHQSESDKKIIPLVMVTTYTPYTDKNELKAALMENWPIIENNATLSKLFPKPPLLALKRGKNLADIIVKSRLPKSDDDHDKIPSRESIPISDNSESTEADTLSNIKMDERDRENIQCLLDLMSE